MTRDESKLPSMDHHPDVLELGETYIQRDNPSVWARATVMVKRHGDTLPMDFLWQNALPLPYERDFMASVEDDDEDGSTLF